MEPDIDKTTVHRNLNDMLNVLRRTELGGDVLRLAVIVEDVDWGSVSCLPETAQD